jgi:hypothetical protein
MKTFDVQSIGINRPAKSVFDYVADPANLPRWTEAFEHADEASADLITPNGSVRIQLKTLANETTGTVDWKMIFPDGKVGMAYSRVTPDGGDKAVYSFVLMAPPVALEMLEGALSVQMETLAKELKSLKARLEA